MDDFFDEPYALGSASADSIPGQQRENPLSVTQVNSIVKGVIDDLIPDIWIAGEISDLSRPQSGHLYFSIKDEDSTVRAVMWRTSAGRLSFTPKDGQRVVGSGKVDVYVPRGSYQIVFRSLHPLGEGGLQAALKVLHAKLHKEGLFAAERKKQLPAYPQRIGFVTSPSGAAIRDFLEMMRNRWPLADVLVIPASVQGENAPREIVAGIQAAERLCPKLDVLVIGRGGGSMEDLWQFNDERVVRAIAACSLPTVSAVGHEIDVTLSDLAADVRALTPSDAAIRCVPDLNEVQSELDSLRTRASAVLLKQVELWQRRLEALADRPVLARPEEVLLRKQQLLDESSARLQRAMLQLLQFKQQKLATLQAATAAMSPLAVLSRGYSITRRADTKEIVRNAADIQSQVELETILHVGRVKSTVTELQ